jgi:hypothetical protein
MEALHSSRPLPLLRVGWRGTEDVGTEVVTRNLCLGGLLYLQHVVSGDVTRLDPPSNGLRALLAHTGQLGLSGRLEALDGSFDRIHGASKRYV